MLNRIAPRHLLVGLLVIAGCQSQPPTPPVDPTDPPSAPSLKLSPGAINVNAGEAPTMFSASVQNSVETVTWTLAGVGSFSPTSGVSTTYTPPESVDGTQSATLVATLGTTGVSASALITVYPASVTPPPDPPPGNSDTTPPTVVSIEPPASATGVAKDAVIVITFSEKMDRAATQAAYGSAELPAGAVTFEWNEAGTVLTVKPSSPLEYAISDDLSVEAKRYSFSVTGAAEDVAGNALDPVASEFTTLRRIEGSLAPAQAELDGYVTSVSGSGPGSSGLYVGDDSKSVDVRSFLSFDLAGVPEGIGEATLERAKLFVYKLAVDGTPYLSLIPCEGNPELCPISASITLEHVSYGSSLGGNDYGTPSLEPGRLGHR